MKITCPQSGFTLTELLIVVSIITVLTVGSLFGLNNAIQRSKVNQALADIQNITQAVEQYHSDLGYYPPDVGPNVDPGLVVANASANPVQPTPYGFPIGLTGANSRWRGRYLQNWPGRTPWGGVYDYEYWSRTDLSWEGMCGGALPPGIYVSTRAVAGIGNVSQFTEQYFKDKGHDPCPGFDGLVFFVVKRL